MELSQLLFLQGSQVFCQYSSICIIACHHQIYSPLKTPSTARPSGGYIILQFMRTHTNVTATKKKKAPPTENRQETAICPNCQYHFKLTIHPQNSHLITAINDLIYSRLPSGQGTPKMSEKGYEHHKDLEEAQDVFPIRQKEDILIESITNTELTHLEKLKRLNDLNRLKKSRYHNQDHTDPNDLQPFDGASMHNSHAYFPQVQDSHRGYDQQSFDLGIKMPICLDKGKDRSWMKGKQSPSRVIKPQTKQLMEYAVRNYEQQVLLQRLIQWIETSFKRDNLPYHLKIMVANYLYVNDQRS